MTKEQKQQLTEERYPIDKKMSADEVYVQIQRQDAFAAGLDATLLTPPADVQERAKDIYIKHWRKYAEKKYRRNYENVNPPPMYEEQFIIDAMIELAGASSVSGMQWVKASDIDLEDQKCYHLKIKTIPELALGGRYFKDQNKFFCSAISGNWVDILGTLVLFESGAPSIQAENERLREALEKIGNLKRHELDLGESWYNRLTDATSTAKQALTKQ